MQQRHADELALVSVSRAQRDELIRRAHRNGMSKYRIHKLTAVSRTTIDRILSTRPAGAEPLPEDVPVCTRMDEGLPQVARR